MPSQDYEFIRESRPKEQVYNAWLEQLSALERGTLSTSTEDRTATDNALDLGFKLFPIIDSISYTLFNKNGRHYLKLLGYSGFEADLIFKMFRNGQMHNTSNYRLRYNNAEISWAISSSSGSGGFSPHFAGYTSEEYPEDNMPADTAFEIVKFDEGQYSASLSLDRLHTHIRYDLEQRLQNDTRESIEIILGQSTETDLARIDDYATILTASEQVNQ